MKAVPSVDVRSQAVDDDPEEGEFQRTLREKQRELEKLKSEQKILELKKATQTMREEMRAATATANIAQSNVNPSTQLGFSMSVKEAEAFEALPEEKKEAVMRTMMTMKMMQGGASQGLESLLLPLTLFSQNSKNSSLKDMVEYAKAMRELNPTPVPTQSAGALSSDTITAIIKSTAETLKSTMQPQTPMGPLGILGDPGVREFFKEIFGQRKDDNNQGMSAGLEYAKLKNNYDLELIRLQQMREVEDAKVQAEIKKAENLGNIVEKVASAAGQAFADASSNQSQIPPEQRRNASSPGASNVVTIPCPKCNTNMYVPNPKVGDSVKCIKCGQVNIIEPDDGKDDSAQQPPSQQ